MEKVYILGYSGAGKILTSRLIKLAEMAFDQILAIKKPKEHNCFPEIANIMAISRMPEIMEYEEIVREIDNYQALAKPRHVLYQNHRTALVDGRTPHDTRGQIKQYKHLR